MPLSNAQRQKLFRERRAALARIADISRSPSLEDDRDEAATHILAVLLLSNYGSCKTDSTFDADRVSIDVDVPVAEIFESDILHALVRPPFTECTDEATRWLWMNGHAIKMHVSIQVHVDARRKAAMARKLAREAEQDDEDES
jgi:hypothetical protein